MSDAIDGKTYAVFETAANRKLIGDLRKSGAKVLTFPPIAAQRNALGETRAACFKNLDQFDWLIFADVFAVDYFVEILSENAVDLYDLDALRVCAFGETVSDRLRFAAVHADVIPSKIAAPEIFDGLADYVGNANIGGLRFLYLTGESERNELEIKLRAENAAVTAVEIYRIVSEETSALIKLKTLLRGGAVDEFVLTAPEDLTALKHYFRNENLAGVFAGINVAASDGVMFQAAREHDLPRVGLFHLAKIDKVI